MGWASGYRVATPIIEAIKREVPDGARRRRIYGEVIAALENADWDTQEECLGIDPEFDRALAETHPDWEL